MDGNLLIEDHLLCVNSGSRFYASQIELNMCHLKCFKLDLELN